MRGARLALLGAALLAPFASGQRVDVRHLPDEGHSPTIAVTSDGTVHVFFVEARNCYYVWAERLGGPWQDCFLLNVEEDSVRDDPEHRPRVSVGGQDVLHLVWQDTAGGIWYTYSDDLGDSWTYEEKLASRVAGLTDSVDLFCPTVAADARGNVWVVWLDGQAAARSGGQVGRIRLTRSEDGGETFCEVYDAEYPESGQAALRSSLEARIGSRKTLQLIGRSAFAERWNVDALEGNTKAVNFRLDRVADDDWNRPNSPAEGPVADADGDRLAVAWRNGDGVFFALSGDGGRTFGRPVGPSGDGAADGARVPVVRFGPRGTLLFAWAEGTEVVWEIRGAGGRVVASGREKGLPEGARFDAAAAADGTFYLVY